ncbi:MAG: response regulator [Acidobacteria bacterium]|nr:response regulator [Acidobacteriota bacterium]
MTPSPHLCVLVVEDETLIRWSIAATLTQKGHTVMEAGSAAAAVETLSQTSQPVDVVLLDVRLPDSSDLGLLADIRRIAPQSAVLMMTAYGTPELTKGALALGACRVLNKPFDMHGLESLILEAHGARLDNLPSRR